MPKLTRFYKNYIILAILFLGIFSNINTRFLPEVNNTISKGVHDSPVSSDVFDSGILYSGIQDPLGINETAIHTASDHYTIGNGTNPDYTSQNAEFPLDVTNDWYGYRYSANITNLVDEQDWILNGNFGSDVGVTPSTHIVQTFESSHPYANSLNSDPSVLANIIASIDGNGCNYMRIHFVNISTEWNLDTLYLWDESNNLLGWYEANYEDLITPWFNTSVVNITMETSSSGTDYGFYIDYFETYNGQLFSFNSDNWTPYGKGLDSSRMNAVASHQLNNSAINVTLAGVPGTGNSYSYKFDESGIYQELSIPRGGVHEAWLSMDYNVLRGINNNEMILFFKINDVIIYQRGFQTITGEGLTKWHTTGLVQISIPSSVFNDPVNDQIVNISVGVQATKNKVYSFNHADLQEVYFDNITLILKAEVNCTNTNINLKIDGLSPIDSPLQWGEGTFNRFYVWDTNPIEISLSTDTLKVEFDLESTIYAFHFNYSKLEEYGDVGSQVIIYTNNSVHWETYYRVYIPLYYGNLGFSGNKPQDWEMLQINNPLDDSVPFLDGEKGDEIFTVEGVNTPGWWRFKARSTNMIPSTSTEVWNGMDWENYLDQITYNISDTLRIRTALNASLGNIENNASTWANLTIYDPDDGVWHTESVHPDITGGIQFSDVNIGAFNTTGGTYRYKIIWTNGTSAGGRNGTFIVQRNLAFSILYPRDAIGDMVTEEILGDVIPLRFILNDSFTGVKLSNLQVQYNWTTGTESLIEISQGIYDGALDTLDLMIPGYHEIKFIASGFGYHNLTFILKVNLVEETEVKIIGLDNNIDYGTNFSIRISYTSKHLSYGIPDANITLNLSSTHYLVTPEVEDGKYMIEISSKDAFMGAGFYDIQINASKLYFQDQDIVTRIQILPRTIYFQIYINSADCTLNKSYSSIIKRNLNFSIGIYSSAEHLPILEGSVYMTDGVYTSEAFEIVESYYYLELNTSQFGLGTHFISIIFNETSYQSASENLMLSITRLNFNASFYNTEETLVIDRNKDFEVIISVEDPLTHLPITEANISYSWVFGRGFLTNLGDGRYVFEDLSPYNLGTYKITFTISSPNEDYETTTLTLTLVSQLPEGTSRIWWFLIPSGIVAIITTSILLFNAYKRKVIIPRQEQEIKLLRK
ncbi:MAG: hypothetical protein JW776_15325, partial [Candidatus Lokiarchaeota archaeon]|nr:hypothetical protein [Candidatus Lokiarchaeota archaeon]